MICTPNTGCPVLGVHIKTAATFCLSGLWQGLPYNGFLAAVAPAFPISSPFYIAPLCSSGADRAAVLLRTGAGVNRRFPTVAGRAFPPDLLMAACCHHLRRQRPVQLRIPLCGKAWLDSRKIVKAGKHFLVCTIRAFRLVTDSVRNGRTEGMSLFAAPPYAAVGRGRYRIRRAVGIFLPIPLCRNFRKLCLQVVFARQNGLSGANRAAVAAACPGRDIGSVAVSVWTYPPDAARGSRQHLLRCQRRVLFIIPFLRNLRKPVCQSVFSDDRNMVCTDRAAGSLRSAMDGRLPLVALRAFPPDLSMGMRCDVCGR